MTPILSLLVDIAGQTVGNLLDLVLWAVMIAAAFKVRMWWMLPAAVFVALALETAMWLGEPADLQAYRFSAIPLSGRAIAGWLIGSGARWFIVRRRSKPEPMFTAAPH